MCGENVFRFHDLRHTGGSSPRVRGKLAITRCSAPSVGLIPACAGKTGEPPGRTRSAPAHPRVCGENEPRLSGLWAKAGSSPRVRGKRVFTIGCGCLWGLIPACAGKTLLGRVGVEASRAHPRVCGENSAGWWCPRLARGSSPRVRGKQPSPSETPAPGGSSPRVRGKPRKLAAQSHKWGLIPACAGKTRR